MCFKCAIVGVITWNLYRVFGRHKGNFVYQNLSNQKWGANFRYLAKHQLFFKLKLKN